MNYNQRDTINAMVYQENMDALEAIMHLTPAATVAISAQYDKTEEHNVYAFKLKEAKQLIMDAYIIREAIKESQKAIA